MAPFCFVKLAFFLYSLKYRHLMWTVIKTLFHFYFSGIAENTVNWRRQRQKGSRESSRHRHYSHNDSSHSTRPYFGKYPLILYESLWLWSYGSWIYNYLCNQFPPPLKCLSSNSVHGKAYSIEHYVIKFVSDLRQVGGFLWVLQFPPPIELTTTI